jgi:phosphoglycolate phosphatase
MNIFFDLDGTIIDSRLRLYRLFCDITSQTILSFGEYWNLKRSMIDHEKMLTDYFHYTKEEYLVFEKKWLSLIESDSYLNFDKPFDFTVDVLQTLKSRNHKLYVITARQSKAKALKQLDNLGLANFFEDVFVTEAKKTKAELIQASGLQLSAEDIFVGDTGMDIKTAKTLNVLSVAVLSGFRNREILSKYLPDYVENDIQFLVDYVKD